MKWLFVNAKRRLSFAAHNPGYAIRSAFRQLTLADERFLARAAGRPIRDVNRFLDEPARDGRFFAHLQTSEAELATAPFESADLYAKKVLLQYVLARALQPEIILETGVANGISTAYLLLALQKNGKGALRSIEIGDRSYLPPNRQPGWIVPDWLRARWIPATGDSRQLLPSMLRQLGTVDLFIHDSLHTYDHMLFEMETAYPHVRPGGLLLADDALWNSAFPDFRAKVGAPVAAIVRGVGVLRK